MLTISSRFTSEEPTQREQQQSGSSSILTWTIELDGGIIDNENRFLSRLKLADNIIYVTTEEASCDRCDPRILELISLPCHHQNVAPESHIQAPQSPSRVDQTIQRRFRSTINLL